MSDATNRLQARLAEMLEATRLTGNGRLTEATVLIQKALTGQGQGQGRGNGPAPVDPPTIDLVAERVSTAKSGSRSPSPSETFKPEAFGSSSSAGHSAAAATGSAAILPDRIREVMQTVVQGLGRQGLGRQGAGRTFSPLLKGLDGTAASPRVMGTGEFSEYRFENGAGARSYKLYVPSKAAPSSPLVVMLHGCTQSPDDFAAGTAMNLLAEELGFLVAYPGQSSRANGHKCWNWFETRDQGRENGEAGIIAGLTRAVIAEHDVDPARVYIAGLSAGAAAAANVAQAYPDLYAALGIHSGLAAGCARDLSSALMAMNMGAPGSTSPNGFGAPVEGLRVPTIVFHGDGDSTVNPRNGDQILAQAGVARLEASEMPVETSTGGLSYARTRFADETGRVLVENWVVKGLGHAWSGGDPSGSYTDARGPDASRAMIEFFLGHRLGR
ncbi:MAG: PHB depolymerase family esterase [Methylobacterium sp.]|uniref:extracellular catalytic domain type 1 short-chain-length polyhydroxyalkanoate depolymerase n=1 Tax=Methylobacterium sp. TaxID=409 RepID=UPI0025CB7BA5|nr:PHB depolymerase family esterase [Methylobacterium sp.]MBX9933854.1 PHB depolymerase family esterase [Methylobacterium sp.]